MTRSTNTQISVAQPIVLLEPAKLNSTMTNNDTNTVNEEKPRRRGGRKPKNKYSEPEENTLNNALVEKSTISRANNAKKTEERSLNEIVSLKDSLEVYKNKNKADKEVEITANDRINKITKEVNLDNVGAYKDMLRTTRKHVNFDVINVQVINRTTVSDSGDEIDKTPDIVRNNNDEKINSSVSNISSLISHEDVANTVNKVTDEIRVHTEENNRGNNKTVDDLNTGIANKVQSKLVQPGSYQTFMGSIKNKKASSTCRSALNDDLIDCIKETPPRQYNRQKIKTCSQHARQLQNFYMQSLPMVMDDSDNSSLTTVEELSNLSDIELSCAAAPIMEPRIITSTPAFQESFNEEISSDMEYILNTVQTLDGPNTEDEESEDSRTWKEIEKRPEQCKLPQINPNFPSKIALDLSFIENYQDDDERSLTSTQLNEKIVDEILENTARNTENYISDNSSASSSCESQHSNKKRAVEQNKNKVLENISNVNTAKVISNKPKISAKKKRLPRMDKALKEYNTRKRFFRKKYEVANKHGNILNDSRNSAYKILLANSNTQVYASDDYCLENTKIYANSVQIHNHYYR